MPNKTDEIILHDIKPLLEIQEYSLYYFLLLMAFSIALIATIIFFLVKYFRSKNNFTLRKEHFESLNNIDFSDSKRSAYDITFYGATFKNDSLQTKEEYEKLLEKVEEYKYKKNVNSINEDVKKQLTKYRELVNV